MSCITQNDLLLQKLMQFYNKDNNLQKMLQIINGESKISLRIVDWFVTNYSKKNYTVINLKKIDESLRIKIYDDYKYRESIRSIYNKVEYRFHKLKAKIPSNLKKKD